MPKRRRPSGRSRARRETTSEPVTLLRGLGRRSSKDAGQRKGKAGRAVANQPVVTIRAQNGQRIIEAGVARSAPLERLAEEWAYILRSRTRWADKPEIRRSIRSRALDDLECAGVPRAFMRQLVSVYHVEVELHKWAARDADANRVHEAAAEIPWEYLDQCRHAGRGSLSVHPGHPALPQ